MENKAMKPVTLIKEDFTNELISVVNSSLLPMFIVEYVLKDILNEVHTIAVKQAQEDGRKYAEQLKEQEETEAEEK